MQLAGAGAAKRHLRRASSACTDHLMTADLNSSPGLCNMIATYYARGLVHHSILTSMHIVFLQHEGGDISCEGSAPAEQPPSASAWPSSCPTLPA